jgi:hypothetical protein
MAGAPGPPAADGHGPPVAGALSPGSPLADGPGAPEEPRVAEVLQQLRSGVRQRSAEVAAFGGGGEAAQEARKGLAAVRAREYVQEPMAFSHRRRLGRFIVVGRKAFFHFFLKWFLRPVIEQQNAFNQAAGRLLQELVEGQDRLARELRHLAARVERIEAGRDAAPDAARHAEPTLAREQRPEAAAATERPAAVAERPAAAGQPAAATERSAAATERPAAPPPLPSRPPDGHAE